jgi:PAS domain S-box-containing protein
MIHDITRRKTIEEALKKNEEQFRSLVYNSSELMLLMDLEGITIYISPQCQQITGYPESKFLNKKMPEIIHPEDVTQVQKSWETIVYKGENLYNLEYRIIDNESKVRWLSHTATVVRTDDKVIGIQSIIRDITSPKMAEQALKVSEEKYRTMLNASPDGILITNLKGIITEVSEIGLQLFGTNNPGDLIGKHFLRFVPPEEKGTVKEIIEKTMNEGLSQNIEIMARKKHLGLFLCETSSTLIQGPDGAPFSFMIIIRDISSRKKLEKKQIHADRMASLGEMASGIAHEINQPLNTISFVVDNIIMELSNLSNDQKSYINRKTDKIFDNISRIRNIIDHVRAFSRSHDDFILSSFKINDSIKNAVSLISEQFRHLGINLQLILERDIKFEQVILNMLSNAKDALLEKANILSAPYEMKMSIKSFYENQNVIVEITDNGTGINDEDIEHITLPFYTTKDSDKGTGLGLSISYQIIREMHGSIEISSKIFEGTTFKIILNYQENKPV